MTDAFVSYSRRDKAFVEQLCAALAQGDRQVWVDWQDIPLTADWRREIYDGIDAADAFIMVLSPASVASAVCSEELQRAIDHHKRLIPLVHGEVSSSQVPPALAKLNWIFLRPTDDFEQGIQALTAALDTDLDHVKTHTRLLTRAVEWEHRQQEASLLLRGSDLKTAEAWLVEGSDKDPRPAPLQRAYVAQSRQGETQRQRRIALGLASGAAVASVLAIAAGVGWYEANRQRVVAEQQMLRAESTAARSLAATGHGFEALLTSLRAGLKLQRTPADGPLRELVITALQDAVHGVYEQNQLVGHSEAVYGVSLSPTGQAIASAGGDGTVKLWSPEGALQHTLRGHNDVVYQVSFSPDGQRLASASADGTVGLWSLDGTARGRLAGHRSVVNSVAYSPDGQLLASASADGTVKLWNRQGQLLHTLQVGGDRLGDSPSAANPHLAHQLGGARQVVLSPDGATLAIASGSRLQLWSRAGQRLATLGNSRRPVLSVAFSPDGQRLASASEDGTLGLWTRAGAPLAQIATGSVVRQVAFSPDGTTLATAGGDGLVKLWHPDGTLLQLFSGHRDGVFALAFSADGEAIASASADGTVRLWRPNGISQQRFHRHSGDVYEAVFSPDGQLMASVGADNVVRLWSQDGQPVKTLTGHRDLIHGVSFSPDGTTLVSASWDGTARLWRTRDGILMRTLTGHSGRVYGAVFSPDGTIIATSSDDNTIKTWTALGDPLATLSGHTDVVHNVSFSPDGQSMVSASHDKTVRLWHRDGQLLDTFEGHTNWVHAVAFGPDGQTIASASHDRTVKLWRRDGTLLHSLVGHTNRVKGVAFSPDGKTLASSSEDHTIRLWRVADGAEMGVLRGHSSTIHGINFSRDGRTLASASEDNAVVLWNLESLRHLEGLLAQGCRWLRGYQQTSPALAEGDRDLCQGLPRP